jgi:hypothetical protein
VLLRLTYLGVTNAFALLRLLPISDHDKDAEILVLRHQITVLQRQLAPDKPRFAAADRAFLAALLHRLPRPTLRSLRLLVRPDTIRRWHRELLARRHAGIDPSPDRAATTWADFLRSQADALLACDFFETHTLSGASMYVFAAIEHTHRKIRILGATAHPTAAWVTQAARNLTMDLENIGSRARFMIRDRDSKFGGGFDAVLADAGIRVVLTGVQMPRMNAITERRIQTCRRELLDRTLIWNQRHLIHALREFERFYNTHQPHQGIHNDRPLRTLPVPIADPVRIARLNIRRHDRLGGILHEYQHAA